MKSSRGEIEKKNVKSKKFHMPNKNNSIFVQHFKGPTKNETALKKIMQHRSISATRWLEETLSNRYWAATNLSMTENGTYIVFAWYIKANVKFETKHSNQTILGELSKARKQKKWRRRSEALAQLQHSR